MRIAYLDCASGISGDMMLGALVDAGAELAAIQAAIDSLGLPRCTIAATEVKKRGFRATQITVEFEPEHKHRHLRDITAMIDGGQLTPQARERAKRVFQRLAEAEAKVHGSTIDKVHFHEVGAVDSIADIVGTAVALDLLGVERLVSSPIPTGHGFVEIAHGRCSIPAPATGELLCGVPLAPLDVEGELTTPTGAAIVAALVDKFGPLPAMIVSRIGYGAGQKEFTQPNILRVLVGESLALEATGECAEGTRPQVESIVVLETNLDDVSGAEIGHCVERLWAAGALDVTLTPMQMKKGRPGALLSAQATPSDVEELESVLFTETTSLGVRRTTVTRTALARRTHDVETTWGKVVGKVAYLPNGSARFTPEFEACRRIAIDENVSLKQVMDAAVAAFRAESQR
jgi:pyridinium-3,5-bisthiocarboxylic acid mononucleotide nickel chelatase